MPRRPVASDDVWPLPGEPYGAVYSRNGMAVLRYKGKRVALGAVFQKSRKRELLQMASDQLTRLKARALGIEVSGRSTGVGAAVASFWKARQIDARSYHIRMSMLRTFRIVFPRDFPLNDDTLHAHLVAMLPRLSKERFTLMAEKDGKKEPKKYGPFSPSSIAKMCDHLQQFFRYAQGRRWLLADPWATIPRPRAAHKGDARTLTTTEIRRVLRWLRSHDGRRWEEAAVLFNLLRHTGMRISEALSLHWADAVDDTSAVNTIEADRIALRLTKTERPREIPIACDTPQTRRIVRAVEKVRALRRNHPVRAFQWRTKSTPSSIFHHAFRACGIDTRDDEHKAHLLRATCEQEWMRAGIDEETVIRIIGHSKQIRQRHYRDKLTADDALARMKRDLGIG